MHSNGACFGMHTSLPCFVQTCMDVQPVLRADIGPAFKISEPSG